MGSGPTQPTEQYFDKGAWGYDGSQWRKLPLLLGYTSIWDENLGGTASGATWNVGTSAIPAGEIRILQSLSIRDLTRATATVYLYIVRASGAVVGLAYVATLAVGVVQAVVGQFLMGPGDVAYVYVGATVAGDTMQGGIVGYKMAVG